MATHGGRNQQSARAQIAAALRRLSVDPETLPGDVFEALVRRSADPELRLMIGRYLVTGVFRRGPKVRVFSAWDPALQRRVAIKVIDPSQTPPSAQAALARALQADMLRLAQRPTEGIVRIFDVGEEEAEEDGPGLSFFVMEHVDGQPLGARLRAGALPRAEALKLTFALAESLALLHRAGVHFVDLHPGAVVLREDGRPVLLDAGELSASVRPGEAVLTRAPECLREQSPGPPADVFALGAILYEALSGQQPFPGDTETARREAILKNQLRPLPQAERQLRAVVQRALEPRPEDRFSTPDELTYALKALTEAPQTGLGFVPGARVEEETLVEPSATPRPDQRLLVTEQVRTLRPSAHREAEAAPTVAARALSETQVRPKPKRARPRPLLLVLGAAASIGVVLGLAAIISARGHARDARSRCATALRAEAPISALEALAAQAPDTACVYLELGRLYAAQGGQVRASAALERFLRLAPEDPDRAEAEALLDRLGER